MSIMDPTFSSGMPGEPLPYLLHTDWFVTTCLYLCMLLTCIAFAKEKKYLLQKAKAFTISRNRSSMFDDSTVSDVRYTFLLKFNTCVLLGFCVYYYYAYHMPVLFEKIAHAWLLGIFIGSIGFFILFKWLLYKFINWIFFQKVRNTIWITSYFNLFIWLGILLLPAILVIVYFDISTQTSLTIIGSLIIFAKISLFWKCFSNFFEKIYGSFHLILYFCALEILPDLILWKGVEMMNNNLILNF